MPETSLPVEHLFTIIATTPNIAPMMMSGMLLMPKTTISSG